MKTKRLSSQQRGTVLPTVLGILLLILVVSSQLSETVTLQHKTNNAFKSQINAESIADFGLSATEESLLAMTDRPVSTETIQTTSDNLLLTGIVWSKTLTNYDLRITQDKLTNTSVGWERQPLDWWNTYGNKYSRNISAGQSQTAYSIVEEFGEDLSGSDLGGETNHYAAPQKLLYQITAKGEGGAFGTSRVRSILAKTFR